jgi:hypothetical protein
LGVREGQQVAMVRNMVRQFYGIRRFILWGRGIGASAVIRDGQGSIFVLDSPYKSVEKVLENKSCWYQCCCGLPSLVTQYAIKKRANIEW